MYDSIDYLPDDDKYKPAIRLVVALLSTIIVFQWVNLLHHWTVILLKWWINRVILHYLRAAEQQQDQIAGTLEEQRGVLDLLKTWYELNRIQTSNQKHIQQEVKKEIHNAVEETGRKIDEIPERVVDKIQGNESGVNKFPTIKETQK